MDRLSIAEGCLSLVAELSRVIMRISLFAVEVREARKDMETVSQGLVSLQMCLGALNDDQQRGLLYPQNLSDQLSNVLTNIDITSMRIDDMIMRFSSGKAGRRNKWGPDQQQEMRNVCASLENDKTALEVALIVGSIATLTKQNKTMILNGDHATAFDQHTQYDSKVIAARERKIDPSSTVRKGNSQTLQIITEIAQFQVQLSKLYMGDSSQVSYKDFIHESHTYCQTLLSPLTHVLSLPDFMTDDPTIAIEKNLLNGVNQTTAAREGSLLMQSNVQISCPTCGQHATNNTEAQSIISFTEAEKQKMSALEETNRKAQMDNEDLVEELRRLQVENEQFSKDSCRLNDNLLVAKQNETELVRTRNDNKRFKTANQRLAQEARAWRGAALILQSLCLPYRLACQADSQKQHLKDHRFRFGDSFEEIEKKKEVWQNIEAQPPTPTSIDERLANEASRVSNGISRAEMDASSINTSHIGSDKYSYKGPNLKYSPVSQAPVRNSYQHRASQSLVSECQFSGWGSEAGDIRRWSPTSQSSMRHLLCFKVIMNDGWARFRLQSIAVSNTPLGDNDLQDGYFRETMLNDAELRTTAAKLNERNAFFGDCNLAKVKQKLIDHCKDTPLRGPSVMTTYLQTQNRYIPENLTLRDSHLADQSVWLVMKPADWSQEEICAQPLLNPESAGLDVVDLSHYPKYRAIPYIQLQLQRVRDGVQVITEALVLDHLRDRSRFNDEAQARDCMKEMTHARILPLLPTDSEGDFRQSILQATAKILGSHLPTYWSPKDCEQYFFQCGSVIIDDIQFDHRVRNLGLGQMTRLWLMGKPPIELGKSPGGKPMVGNCSLSDIAVQDPSLGRYNKIEPSLRRAPTAVRYS